MNHWTLLMILLVGLAFLILGCNAARAGYESAPFNLIRKDGKFEVRDYPALTVVETSMGSGGNTSDGSFMRLYHFITGRNEANQKIAMTTPVFMAGNGTNATMSFVMPVKMKSGAVPKPTDNSLTVREFPAGRFAILRYSGGRNAKNQANSLIRLQTWMAKEGLRTKAPPVYGYFDPPWIPTFLRRNEVMLLIDAEKP